MVEMMLEDNGCKDNVSTLSNQIKLLQWSVYKRHGTLLYKPTQRI